MPWSRLLMWAFAASLVAAAALVWPDVPERIPVHFGPSGEPDRWADRSLADWLTLPIVGLALAALMEGAVWLIRRPGAPGLNLPNKDAILALPPERRPPVIDRVAAWLYRLGCVTAAAFVLIQVGVWTEAHGADGRGWVFGGALVALLGSFAALPSLLVSVDAEVKRQRAAEAQPASL